MRPLPILLAAFLALLTSSQVIGQEKTGKEDNRPPYELDDKELDKKLGVDEKTGTLKDYVCIISFHRIPVCSSCQLMSNHVYETVAERFVDEVKTKQVVLRYRDFEEEKNADLVKKLGIKSPSLAVLQIKGGKMVKAKLAATIWSLAAEKEKFMDQVEEDINWYLSDFEEEQE